MTIDTAQGVNLWHHHDIFDIITIVDHQIWRILCPHINPKRAFTCSLQGWTIDTIGTTIILPGEIILTFRVDGAITNRWERRRGAFTYHKAIHPTFPHIGSDEKLTIVSPLVRHIKSCSIQNAQTVAGGSQTLANRIQRQFYHFLTILIRRIAHFHNQPFHHARLWLTDLFTGLGTSSGECCQKHQPTNDSDRLHFMAALKWLMA